MAKQPTILQMDIIAAWADGLSRSETAERLNCSVAAVDKARNDPDLKRLYCERQQAQIESLVPAALKRLTDIINDDTMQGSVHIAAVREVLDRAHLSELLDRQNADIKVEIKYI